MKYEIKSNHCSFMGSKKLRVVALYKEKNEFWDNTVVKYVLTNYPER